MKLASFLLAGSLATNALLLGTLMMGGPGAGPAPSETTAPATADLASAKAEATAEAWARLESDDLAAHVERLRAEDFPPALVRAIVTAQVRERFASRRQAIEGSGDSPYWLPLDSDPATRQALAALGREERKIISDLLGPDPENGTAARLARQYPNFSPEKIAQLAQIRERYDEKRSEILTSARGMMTDAIDQENLDALEKALRQEFAGVLSPEELEEYDLRTSRAAQQIRSLVGFNPTEQEFRTLYQLQSAFDERYGVLRGALGQEEMRARGEAQRQLGENIKAALGAERYADYQRAADFNFRRITQLVARLDLPPETANELYSVQQDIQRRAGALRGDASLPPAERSAQLGALAAEAETKIASKLGPRGLEAYKQNGGTWMQSLTPRPVLPRK